MNPAELQRQLDDRNEELRAVHLELSRTNSEFMQLTLELDDRVAERTAALVEANAALEAENAVRCTAERRLREQAELIDKAREVIITTDLDNRIKFWNPAAEHLLGWTAAEIAGQHIREVFTIGQGGGGGDIEAVNTGGQDWRGEMVGHSRTGRPLILETSITVLRDEAGRPTGRLSISTDISERRKLEETLLRAQRLESVGMLAAGIAHDLNNVLTPIGVAASLLRLRMADSGALRLLDTLENCVARGTGLVRHILGFAHGVGGEPRLVQVKHLLRDIAELVGTFPKSITLEEQVPSDLWPIQGNPTQIHQVLLNLCVNARDAMPDGGTLRLGAENCELSAAAAAAIENGRPGAWVVLQVEDTGTGIPPEVVARIWEPFFTTKAADRGTGLGMSTVRGIIETHRGFVTLATAPGRGTTFRVYLPAAETAGGEAKEPESAASRSGGGELILVVDDEELIRDTVEQVLASVGYRVISAADGAAAVAVAATRGAEIALVITDYDMPGLDGGSLVRVLRAEHPEIKILVVSGLTSAGPGQAENRVAEGDAFLSKPFRVETLLKAVARILGRESVGAS